MNAMTVGIGAWRVCGGNKINSLPKLKHLAWASIGLLVVLLLVAVTHLGGKPVCSRRMRLESQFRRRHPVERATYCALGHYSEVAAEESIRTSHSAL
jgi:hypothetical protein